MQTEKDINDYLEARISTSLYCTTCGQFFGKIHGRRTLTGQEYLECDYCEYHRVILGALPKMEQRDVGKMIVTTIVQDKHVGAYVKDHKSLYNDKEGK